jgi:hypothetical protein
MAAESSRETTDDQVESFVDELIGKIFTEGGNSAGPPGRNKAATAALFEAAFGGKHSASRTSMLEQVLFAQTFADELADALAPALAEQLAPRLLSALQELMTAGTAETAETADTGRRPAPNGRSGAQSRKPETK